MLSKRASLSNPTRECGGKATRESREVWYVWSRRHTRAMQQGVWGESDIGVRDTGQHVRAIQCETWHAHRHVCTHDDAVHALIRLPHPTSSLGTHTPVVSDTVRTITLRYNSMKSGCATPHSRVGLLKGSASGRRRSPQTESLS